MKRKYIIQLRRKYLWEDILTFYDRDEAISYLNLCRSQDLNCRLLEVLCIM